MNLKIRLQQLQKLIPNTWLEQMQYLHSSLIFRWILRNGSKPLVFSQKSAMVFSPHQDDETFGNQQWYFLLTKMMKHLVVVE